MIRLLRLTAAIAALAVLAGCANYQFGDATSRVLDRQLQYCANASPTARAAAIQGLQAAGLPLPDSGVCTSLASLLLAGDLPEIDTATTEANREWARKQLEAGE